MKKKTNNNSTYETVEELDNICEFCKKKHETVNQNLILTGFKSCESCRLSKTMFPI